MNIQSQIRTTPAADKFDALERFSAAMQSIRQYREDIASDAAWDKDSPLDNDPEHDRALVTRLANAIGTAHIALSQMPSEWRTLMEPELTARVRA